MATQSSSLDKEFTHPYVLERKAIDILKSGKSNGWKTSKIIRKDEDDDTSEIVEIKIINK